MRVCIIAGTYPPAKCGVGDYSDLLAKALAANGAEVTVITSAYLGTVACSGNPSVWPVVQNWSLKSVATILGRIAATKPDIVHFQFPTLEYHEHKLFDLLVPLTKWAARGAKTVITWHEAPFIRSSRIPGILRPLRYWFSMEWSDGIISVAESYRNSLSALSVRYSRIPWRVIPIASNIPVSRASAEELQTLREAAGLTPASIGISFFGFIQPRKGFEDALNVLKLLRSRNERAELTVVGELSENSSYQRGLLSRIEQDGLGNFVKIKGHLDSVAVADNLAMSDVCLLPFVDGVHPKRGSFLAAVQQGVLTVTTHTERRGLSPEENVYYCKPGNIEEMTAAIQRYSRRKVARGSSEWQTWEKIAESHLLLFDSLRSSPRNALLREQSEGSLDAMPKTFRQGC